MSQMDKLATNEEEVVASTASVKAGEAPAPANWVEMNCRGTLNYSDDWVTTFMTGYLNYQIEHHLVPTMPQWNYPLIAKDVKEMCEAHRIPYRCEPFSVALQENHRMLHGVAARARGDCLAWLAGSRPLSWLLAHPFAGLCVHAGRIATPASEQ